MDPLSLLARAHEAGIAVAIAGDKLVVRGPQRAEPVVRLLAEHKSAVMSALAADWRARYRETLAYWSALHPAARNSQSKMEMRRLRQADRWVGVAQPDRRQ